MRARAAVTGSDDGRYRYSLRGVSLGHSAHHGEPRGPEEVPEMSGAVLYEKIHEVAKDVVEDTPMTKEEVSARFAWRTDSGARRVRGGAQVLTPAP